MERFTLFFLAIGCVAAPSHTYAQSNTIPDFAARVQSGCSGGTVTNPPARYPRLLPVSIGRLRDIHHFNINFPGSPDENIRARNTRLRD